MEKEGKKHTEVLVIGGVLRVFFSSFFFFFLLYNDKVRMDDFSLFFSEKKSFQRGLKTT